MAKTSLGTSHYGNDYGISDTLGNFAQMLDPKIAAEAALNRQHGELYAAQKLNSVAATDKLKAETELLKMRSAALDPQKLVDLYGPEVAQAVMASQPKSPSEILEALTKMKVITLASKGDADSLRLAAILNKTPGATSSKASFSTEQGANIESAAASAKLAQILGDRKLANEAMLKKAELDNAGRAAIDKSKPVIVPSGASALLPPDDPRLPKPGVAAPAAPAAPDATGGVVPLPGSSITEAPSGLTSMFKTEDPGKSFDFWGSKVSPTEISPDNPFAVGSANIPNSLQDNGPSLSAPDAGFEMPKLEFDNNAFLAAHPDVPFTPQDAAPAPAPAGITNPDGTPFKAAPIAAAASPTAPSNVFTAPVDPSKVRPMAVNPGQGVREYDPATKSWKEVKAADPKLTVVGNNSRAVDNSGTEIVPAAPQATNPRTAINEERLNKEAAEAVGKQSGVGIGIRGGKDKKGKAISGMVPTEHADAVGRAARKAYPDLAPSDAVALFIKNQGITFDKEDDQHWYSPNSENSAKIPMVIPRVGGKPFHNPTPVADVAAPAAPAAPAAAAPASIVPDTAPAAPTPAAAPAAASPVKVSNEAEYKALPVGTSYLAPDGSVRIKKE